MYNLHANEMIAMTSTQRALRSTQVLAICFDIDAIIRPSQTAAFPTFAAKWKEVLNLSSQEDLVPN